MPRVSTDHETRAICVYQLEAAVFAVAGNSKGRGGRAAIRTPANNHRSGQGQAGIHPTGLETAFKPDVGLEAGTRMRLKTCNDN